MPVLEIVSVRPDQRSWALALVLALSTVACGAPPAEPNPAPRASDRAPPDASSAAEPSAKEDRETRVPAGAVDEMEPPPLFFAGRLLRMYRRPVATGIIQVHEERVADLEGHRRGVTRLRRSGWRPWPPQPAPELAGRIAGLDDRECPFLYAVAERAAEWPHPPERKLTCFSTVHELELALAREAQLHANHARTLPCVELRGLAKEDFRPRVKELRAFCEAMGVEVEPDRDLVRRERRRRNRNSTMSQRIRH